MPHHVCPWWLGYLLASPVRKLFQDPAGILAPHVHEGMTVLEPGPGMGFFTLELARRVGPRGQVVAVDVQERMLAGLLRRARRAAAGRPDRGPARLGQLAGHRRPGREGGSGAGVRPGARAARCRPVLRRGAAGDGAGRKGAPGRALRAREHGRLREHAGGRRAGRVTAPAGASHLAQPHGRAEPLTRRLPPGGTGASWAGRSPSRPGGAPVECGARGCPQHRRRGNHGR